MQNYNIINLLGFEDKNIIISNSYTILDTIYIDLHLCITPHSCPNCSNITSYVHDYRIRKIKHSFHSSYKCIINYNRRRYICKSCGTKFPENNLFVYKHNKISNYTKFTILNEYRKCQSFKDIASRLNVSSSTVIRHSDKHIAEFKLNLPSVLSIDEFKNHKNGVGKYSCLLIDPINKKAIDILPDRKFSNLLNYISKIPLNERNSVKYFISDMWFPYKSLAQKRFPNAIIIADTFHFVRHVYWAFNNTRIRIMKRFNKKSIEYLILKKHWKLLIKNSNEVSSDLSFNKKLNCLSSPLSIVDMASNMHPDLAEAILLKDDFFDAVDNFSYDEFKVFIDVFIDRLRNSNVKEFRDLTKTFKNWKNEICNSFIRYKMVNESTGEVITKKYSNGIIEGVNNFIKVTKRISYGYRNFTRFKKRIMHNFNKVYLLSA